VARSSKPPDERREDLVLAAMALFLDKGYERCSVSDIVRKVGVAQGTFYYHFRSKDELLDAVVARHIDTLQVLVQAALARAGADVLDRLMAVLDTLFTATAANRALIAFLLKPGNELLHERLRQGLVAVLLPVLGQLVERGVAEGRMAVEHQPETLALLLAAFAHLAQASGQDAQPESLQRLRQAVRQLFSRALGVQQSPKS